MHRPLRTVQLLLVLSLGSIGAADASDWPGWRGPQRDGRSAETGLLGAWPEGGPPLAWKTTGLGAGFSSVSVADGRIYTLGDLDDGQYAFARKQSDGSPLWQTRIGPTWEDRFPGPRSTPTVDGDRIHVLGSEGDLVCLQAATGEVVWRRNLPKDFGGRLMQAMGRIDWRYAESPLIDGGRVIVTPGAADAALVALDKTTGEEIWRAAVPALGERGADGAAYSSVVISNGAGVKQYVQFLGRGVVGIEADGGRFLWGYNRVANDVANIATPLVNGDHVFVSSGYGTGSALLKLTADGEGGVRAEEVYFLEANTLQNHHGGLILDRGTVYTGSGHNKGFPVAAKLATGVVAWGPVRNDGESSAALTYADGRLYFRYQNGLMVLVEATPEAYREHGSFMIPNVERESWPHPAIAGGHLLIREQDALYAYDLRPKGQAAAEEDASSD